MFEQLLSKFEIVDEAIIACDAEVAQMALTSALLQLADIYRPADGVMQKLFPILEELRKELKHDNFEEARLINFALLARFREAQSIANLSSGAHMFRADDSKEHTELSNASGQKMSDLEKRCAIENAELMASLRASGLTVNERAPPQDMTQLTATLHRARQKPNE